MTAAESLTTALNIAAFVIPLGIDTLAVAIALGMRGGVRPLAPALLFTAFEAAMPLLGLVAGRYVRYRIEPLAVALGGVILIAVGLHTLREALAQDGDTRTFALGTLRGAVAAGLGISTDEIAVGFPLGALQLPVGAVLAAIAAQAFLVTYGGILIGRRVGVTLGMRASRIAALAAGIAFVLLGSSLIAARFVPR